MSPSRQTQAASSAWGPPAFRTPTGSGRSIPPVRPGRTCSTTTPRSLALSKSSGPSIRSPPRAVVEFRRRSWINEETMAFLRQAGAGYCGVDAPPLPGLPPPMAEVTAPVGYVRFHGRNKEKWWHHEKAEERYDYRYAQDELEEWIPKIRKLADHALRVYVFFNNHVRGQAPANAKELRARLGPT